MAPAASTAQGKQLVILRTKFYDQRLPVDLANHTQLTSENDGESDESAQTRFRHRLNDAD